MKKDRLLQTETAEEVTYVKNKNRHIIRNVLFGIIALALIVTGVYAYRIFGKPSSLFNQSTLPATTSTIVSTDANVTPIPTPTEGIKPSLPNIVNVLLMGLDWDEFGHTTSGTIYHTDTMMIAAINFDKGTIDLISLPRDTLSHVPGIKGIYKLNAAINVGGGIDAPNQAGFMKVCEAAEWMLGGINVDYFYALQYDSLINLVDSVGGVDYDVDIKTSFFNKGLQHLDGKTVLKYLRARTDVILGGANDKSRVNRQKKILVAIFSKLKSNGLLTSVPTLLNTVSHIYTNVTAEQTLALANYAMNVEGDSIGQYSLFGQYQNVLSWNFTIVDQANRVAVIKDVFGVDVPQYIDGTFDYVVWLSKHGFPEWKYLATANKVEVFVKPLLTAEIEQQTAYSALQTAYAVVEKGYAISSVTMNNSDTTSMERAMAELKTCTIELADMFGYTAKLDWSVSEYWWNDLDINSIYVDFG